MTPPILCYECGEYLGAVFEFIKTIKHGFYKELVSTSKKAIDVDKIDISETVTEPIGWILDAAQITKICCRKCFIGYIDFSQF